MTRSPDAVFRKTELGQDELRSRRHGLSMRARQLLILADGQRRVDELARLLPRPELESDLSQLDEGGFIEAVPRAAANPPAPPPAPPDAEDFAHARQRIVRALLDSVGPSGDEMAIRIERSRSRDELVALLPAAVAIVEAIRGRVASREFALRIGLHADLPTGTARGGGAIDAWERE